MQDNRVQIIIEGIDRASKTFDDLNKQLRSLKRDAERSGSGLGDSFSRAKPHLEGVYGQLGAIARQLAAIMAAWKLLDAAKDALLLASRVETLSAVLGALGKNVGLTRAQMAGYVEQVRQMGITTEASQQVIARMVQAQLDLTKASQLARVAQDAAVLSNINSSEAMERLLHGITTMNPLILKNIGIIVDFEREYRKAAEAAGKTTAQLTAAEKQQIALNAVIEQGVKIEGAYESAMDTANKQLGTLSRYIDELKLKLGEIGGGAFTAVVFEIVNGFKEWDKALASMSESGATDKIADDLQYGVLVAINDIKTLMADIWNVVKEFGPVLKFFIQLIVKAADGWGYIYAAMKPVTEIMGKLIAMAMNFYQILYNAAGVMMSIVTKDWAGVKKYASNIATAAREMATNAVDAAKKYSDLPGDVADSLLDRETVKQKARKRVEEDRKKRLAEQKEIEDAIKAGLPPPTYKTEEPVTPAAKTGRGGESALENWAARMRDLNTDMAKALFPHDALAHKLDDIRNKYDDLMAQARKYAREHGKAFDTSKVEQWRKTMEAAALAEDAEKKLEVWTDIEQQITDRTASELQKRLAAEEKFITDSEKKLKKAGFTQEEIAERMVKVTEAAAEKKKKIEIDYINTVMEAESRRYLAQLDMLEKNRAGSKSDITQQRISVYESLLQSYQRNWETEADPTAKILWADKIDEVRSKLVDLNITLKEQRGLFADGLGQGLRDYLWEMKSVFQQGVDIARETAQAMEQAFSDFFFDAFQGKLKTVSDYLSAFFSAVQRSLANVLGQKITGGITQGFSALFGSGSSTLSHEMAHAQQHHTGGTVQRYIPTFHGGGLNTDERLVINRVGERYITEEQNAWLNRVAKSAEGSSNVTFIFENGPGVPPLKASELSKKRDNKGEVRRIILELADSDPTIRGILGMRGA